MISNRERLEKLGLTTLLERIMRGDLIETLKINEITNYGSHFFIFSLELEIYCQYRFQKLSQLTNWIFLLIE